MVKASLTIVHAIELELVVDVALLLSIVDGPIDGFGGTRHRDTLPLFGCND